MRTGLLTSTISLPCCLNHLSNASSTSLRSGFRNRFILDPFRSNSLLILVLFLQIVWGRRNYETRFPTHVSFLFYLSYHFTLFRRRSKPSFYRDCSHVITLPVKCDISKRRKPLTQWRSITS